MRVAEATCAGLVGALAQQRRQLAGVGEQLAVAVLDRHQQLDHGVGGVGLQQAVLGVALGQLAGVLVGGGAEDLEQVADARLADRVEAAPRCRSR